MERTSELPLDSTTFISIGGMYGQHSVLADLWRGDVCVMALDRLAAYVSTTYVAVFPGCS